VKRPARKNIPAKVKAEVLARQNNCCAECHEPFTADDKIEYDHRPSIIMRAVNVEGTDYHPPQNDPDHIDALHARPCHIKRTIGRMPGAEKTTTTKGSDIWLKSKFDRLEGRVKPKRKHRWPKRRFGQ
jgi:hypothetical protein